MACLVTTEKNVSEENAKYLRNEAWRGEVMNLGMEFVDKSTERETVLPRRREVLHVDALVAGSGFLAPPEQRFDTSICICTTSNRH